MANPGSRRRNLFIILAALAVSFICAFFLTRHFLNRRHLATYPGLVGEALFILRNEAVVEVDTSALLSSALQAVKEEHGLAELATGFDESYTDEQVLQEFGLRRQQVLDKTGLASQLIDYELLGGLGRALDQAGDHYCKFMDPQAYAAFKEQMLGETYTGIGVEVRIREQRPVVAKILEGTPAARSGLEVGDVLVKIDGRTTSGEELETVTHWIRGPVGSTLSLEVEREGRTKTFQIVRAKVLIRSVESAMLSGRIGYTAIHLFGETTAEEFKEDLKRLEAEGAKALILDLRDNGGGYIDAAAEVLSAFLETGTPLVSVVNERTRRDDPTYAAGGKAVKWPLVVLVNQESASAAEIAAGALKDHRRARLIGANTFGKGSVQSLHEFGDGGAFKYTVAHYLTPNGNYIEGKGVRPDLEVAEIGAASLEEEAPVARAIESLERQLASVP